MAQKTVWLPEIGEVLLSKRKGSKSIRLSISAAGKIRVGLPAWAPYAAGISFVKSRTDWINQHQQNHQPRVLLSGSRIGKSYRLSYTQNLDAPKTSTRLSGQSINVISSKPLEDSSVQAAAVRASERALKKEAEALLPGRLASLADKNGYVYRSLRIKKLASRWGSCSSEKVITLNYFLMQLPWGLIDYVLVHELVHTKHLNHSPSFWNEFDSVYTNAKKTRSLLKEYRPVINSVV